MVLSLLCGACATDKATQRTAGPLLIGGGVLVGAGASTAAFVGLINRCGSDADFGPEPCASPPAEFYVGVASIAVGVALVTWGIAWTIEGNSTSDVPSPSSSAGLWRPACAEDPGTARP